MATHKGAAILVAPDQLGLAYAPKGVPPIRYEYPAVTVFGFYFEWIGSEPGGEVSELVGSDYAGRCGLLLGRYGRNRGLAVVLWAVLVGLASWPLTGAGSTAAE